MNTFVIRDGSYLASVEERTTGVWMGSIFHLVEGLGWTEQKTVGPGEHSYVCPTTYKLLHELMMADIHERETPISPVLLIPESET